MTNNTIRQVRQLFSEHIGNPQRRAAREARAQYIGELLAATMRDGADIVDREAKEWLHRLTDLCEAHAGSEEIKPWYQLETERLRRLIG